MGTKTPRPNGRPRGSYHYSDKEICEALTASHGIYTYAAAYIRKKRGPDCRIVYKTIAKRVAERPKVRAARDHARLTIEDRLRMAIVEEALGKRKPWAVRLLARLLFGTDGWDLNINVNVTAGDGQPQRRLSPGDFDAMSTEQIIAQFNERVRAIGGPAAG